ncbi:hypothetical protein PG990_003174 [Apiospora arundinis]
MVFASQGLAALRRTVPVVRLGLGIMPYTKGHIPSGIYYDDGRFILPEEGDTFIAVAHTNVSSWIHSVRDGERFMIIWTLDFGNADRGDHCGMDTWMSDRIMFSIKSKYDLTHGQPQWQKYVEAVEATVPTDQCPIRSMVYDIQRNTTTPLFECFLIANQTVTGRQGDPCAVGIDQAVASSIQSQASSLATSAWRSKNPEPTSSSTLNFAVLPTAPVAGSTFVILSLVTYLTFGL